MSSPLPSNPDFSRPFIIDTDASEEGIGAVLSQEVNGRETVISYASRKLSKCKRRYSVTRKELLAVVTQTCPPLFVWPEIYSPYRSCFITVVDEL